MFKRITGYVLVIVGFLCFLIVGGGSMRYRKRLVNPHTSLSEDIMVVLFLIIIPIIGYFFIKIGFRILKND